MKKPLPAYLESDASILAGLVVSGAAPLFGIGVGLLFGTSAGISIGITFAGIAYRALRAAWILEWTRSDR